MKKLVVAAIFALSYIVTSAQVEHVPVSNSVYTFLEHAQVSGWIEHFSIAQLPLSRGDVAAALRSVAKHSQELSEADKSALAAYSREFGIAPDERAVVFYSSSDSAQVLSSRFISDDEKFIYHYQDKEGTTLSIKPLGSVDAIFQKDDNSSRNVTMGNLGLRLHGTLSGMFGYYLQATNGVVLSGSRDLALEDPYLHQNLKFSAYNSDFDFTESHVAFEYKWFRAEIGRETRQIGSGLNQKFLISNGSPAFDAISLGAKWTSFEYKFTHGSLLSYSDSAALYGSSSSIPNKYLAMHRFALRPSWGEVAFSEMVIYSKRDIDLGYLNPLSFFKSLEHALHDRDNSLMSIDFTIRPLKGIELRGTYLLDDIVFSEIGKNYWSNKDALSLSLFASVVPSLDLGAEYSRVEPYTFSHFSGHNAVTNDQLLLCGALLPNSDQTSLVARYWAGGRYPIVFSLSYIRHGENVTDAQGNVVRNVGGDPLLCKRPEDSMKSYFLDGIRKNSFVAGLQAGYEICRGFNLQATYRFISVDEQSKHYARLVFRFDEF